MREIRERMPQVFGMSNQMSDGPNLRRVSERKNTLVRDQQFAFGNIYLMRLWDVQVSMFHEAVADLNLDFRQRYIKV